MKVIISLQEFYDAVTVVAKEHNQTYLSVKAQISSYGGLELSGYINGFSWQTGGTIGEVCQKLRAEKHPIEKTIAGVTDVEVETEKPTDQQIDEGLADLKKVAAEIPAVAELKPLE